MKLLKGIVFAVIGLVAVLAVIGFVLPDSRHVERSIVINAPPATVFGVLNGYAQFNQWSPWAALDPKAKYEVSGPATGVGAREAWHSDDPNVGSGSQEITESIPDQKIVQKLVFGDFTSVNIATFDLAAEGQGTRVKWSYDSTFNGNLMYRYFGLMLDKMVGGDYERGLQRMKVFIESLPPAAQAAAAVPAPQP